MSHFIFQNDPIWPNITAIWHCPNIFTMFCQKLWIYSTLEDHLNLWFILSKSIIKIWSAINWTSAIWIFIHIFFGCSFFKKFRYWLTRISSDTKICNWPSLFTEPIIIFIIIHTGDLQSFSYISFRWLFIRFSTYFRLSGFSIASGFHVFQFCHVSMFSMCLQVS